LIENKHVQSFEIILNKRDILLFVLKKLNIKFIEKNNKKLEGEELDET